MQYDNTNSGALFRNNKKQTEKHPDYTGSLNVEGREFYLSAWINESKNGQKYQKISLTAKDEVAKQHNQVVDQAKKQVESWQQPVDDDIPF